MSEQTLPPSASTTLVILLGASAWPNSPGYQASKAFLHAAQGFRDYLLDPQGFGLPAANLLDLFDAPSSASDQLEQLGSFLEQRIQALKAANQAVRDVLVYFVGHGGFAGPSADFYLLLRRTTSTLRASGIGIDALADVLREKARQTRRYLFLDCCFAAAAFRAFQGGPDQTAITKTQDAFHVQARGSGFPRKGTVLLCSSDQKSPSLLLPDESCTMFSRALLDVFRNGDPHRSSLLSLRDIKELAEDRLAAMPGENAPHPGLHSPDQSEGDVADVRFFPNPRSEEERRHQAEEAEQARLAVEKRLKNVEKQISPKPESVESLAPVSPLTEDEDEVESEILRRIRHNDIPASWKVFRPAKNHLLWHSITYYFHSDEGKAAPRITRLTVVVFAILLFVTLGIWSSIPGFPIWSLIPVLVGCSMLLVTGSVMGIHSWRAATRSVLIVTPDRLLWGNWQKEYVEQVYRYRDYTKIIPVSGSDSDSLLGIKVVPKTIDDLDLGSVTVIANPSLPPRDLGSVTVIANPSLPPRDLGTKEKPDYFPDFPPSLFELPRDLARTIADAHKQFLRSNQGNA